MRVLVADDSVISRHLLDAPLRQWGYEVVIACDGTEAWRILQQDNAPRLAILDWMMPGMTGLEICQKIRQMQREPYTYVLLVTSKNLKQDLIAGMEAGADDYIIKPFDQHELKVRLRSGTRIVQLQTELLAAREALRIQATRDSLTRLWNRLSIMEALQREVTRAERERHHIGLMLIDIDFFKKINDTYGHIAGDAVLREVARRMSASIRTYDFLGRYGGEEFLMVLPGCDREAVKMHAERVRIAICREPLRLGEGETELNISASFGATTYIPGCGNTLEDMIRNADAALYGAKSAGRNRVIYQETPSRRR
jgi:two-component system, cell cycle response regulator